MFIMSCEPLLLSYGAKALSVGQQCRVRSRNRPFVFRYGGRKNHHGVTWPETYTYSTELRSVGFSMSPKLATSSHPGLVTLRQEMIVLHGGKCQTCGAPSQVGGAANYGGARAPTRAKPHPRTRNHTPTGEPTIGETRQSTPTGEPTTGESRLA